VLAGIVMGPTVEREAHGLPVVAAEQRLDVLPEPGRLAGRRQAGSGSVSSSCPGGASAETRDPGGPAAVSRSRCGIGMCPGGSAPIWEFSTASRVPHSM